VPSSRVALAVVALAVVALVLGACDAGASPAPTGPTGTEMDGEPASELSVWVRQDTQAFYELLADEYGSTHDTQIVLTPIRQADFVTRVSSAAATGDLPDLLSTDVAFVRPFLEAGVFIDTTERIGELPHADAVLPAYLEASTFDGAQYAVPAAIDVSSLFYNKALYEEAGLDPEQPPTSWAEILEHARTIDALGDDINGYYFAGRCGGCNGFTMLPMIWASGGEVLAGDSVTVDSPEMRALLELYREMWSDGLMPSSAETDGGESWITAFETGQVGIAPYGSFAVNIFGEDTSLEVGVTLIPGEDDGTSSFAGGDVMGITTGTANEGAAWDFIEWMLSDEVQVDVIAANGYLVDRTDLADNEFAQENPLIAIHNEAAAVAQVPDTAHFNELFTNPSGPWNQLMQDAVFGDDIDGGLQRAQAAFEEISQD
jgi:multiple sugar transport system substrate-binding protein